MNNKVLIFLAKFVGLVVTAFIVDIAFQYFEHGLIDYYKAIRFGLIFGVVFAVGRELRDYYLRKKKQ